MKTLIQTTIVIFVFYTFFNIVSSGEKPKTDNVLENFEQKSNSLDETQDSNESSKKSNKETIIIKGLGNIDNRDLNYASKVIENFFGCNCVIGDNIEIPENIFSREGVIDAPKSMSEFDNSTKTIYIIDKGLEENGVSYRGYTTLYGKSIIVRNDRSFMEETLIHEFGHTLGLFHCDDLSCIMAINNDQYDSGDFCKNCKSKLNK